MEPFTILIAGISAEIQPLHLSTREYCKGYLSDLPPHIRIVVTPDDLWEEQRILEQEAAEQGIRSRKFPEPFLERSVLLRKFAISALSECVLLLHGSAVGIDGRAYLFTAPCGTGKSTHARLWREVFGSRVRTINDDKPFLRLSDGGVFACGAPWSGKHGLNENISLPLGGICILSRGLKNSIQLAEVADMGDFLESQLLCYRNLESRFCARSLLNEIVRHVSVWRMSCNRDPEAARISYSAMAGERFLPKKGFD